MVFIYCEVGDIIVGQMTEERRLQKAAAQKRYKQTAKGRATQNRYFSSKAKLEANRRYRNKYPEKIKAIRILNNNLKKGLVTRQVCMVCKSKITQAHHPDYSMPLNVIWLCPIHHAAEHRLMLQAT